MLVSEDVLLPGQREDLQSRLDSKDGGQSYQERRSRDRECESESSGNSSPETSFPLSTPRDLQSKVGDFILGAFYGGMHNSTIPRGTDYSGWKNSQALSFCFSLSPLPLFRLFQSLLKESELPCEILLQMLRPLKALCALRREPAERVFHKESRSVPSVAVSQSAFRQGRRQVSSSSPIFPLLLFLLLLSLPPAPFLFLFLSSKAQSFTYHQARSLCSLTYALFKSDFSFFQPPTSSHSTIMFSLTSSIIFSSLLVSTATAWNFERAGASSHHDALENFRRANSETYNNCPWYYSAPGYYVNLTEPNVQINQRSVQNRVTATSYTVSKEEK